MKTIFLTVYHPYASRNVLSNGAIEEALKNRNLRIILFCPEQKKNFFQSNYNLDNLIIESIPGELNIFRNKINNFFDRWTQPLLSTFTIDLRIKERLYNKKTLRSFIVYFFDKICFFLGRLKIVRNLVRKFDYVFSNKSFLDDFIDKYHPTLFFLTDIFSPEESMFAFVAMKKNIKISAMVRSWDGTTNKRIFRFIPDKLIVANDYIKNEAIKYHDMPMSNIYVSGMPQYDLYYYYLEQISDQKFKEDRMNIFYKKTGLNKDKPMMLFAPAGSFLTNIDWQILEIIKQAQDKNLISKNIQFLVRNHPSLPSDLSQFSGGSNYIVEQPGVHLEGKIRATEMDLENIYHICDSIYFSICVIEFSSTIGLDSALINKPTIMIGFDGWIKKPYIDSVKRYQDEINMRNFVSLGGGKIVKDGRELIKEINIAIKNPSLYEQGRKLAVEKIIKIFDGKCYKRIAEQIVLD